MKVLKNTIIFSSILLLVSCISDNKKDLSGTWESYETIHPKKQITFYSDSIVLNPFGFLNGTVSETWKVDATKIYLKNIIENDAIIQDEITYDYKLNDSKDTLLIKIEKGSKDDFSLLTRVK